MKITCPANPEHKSFVVTAHVTEDWVVDAKGNFVVICANGTAEVVHRPDLHDLYICETCDTQAKVERD